MKRIKSAIFFIAVSGIIIACSSTKSSSQYIYQPDDQQLHDTIVKLDSIFFEAYNTCNLHLEEYAAFYSDSIEFYHDKGGVMNSKQEIVASTQKYVCGKVTRELIKGSIEVYPIKNYGAIEMGLHRFHNNQEPNDGNARAGKFVVVWQHTATGWKITRVISLH